MIFLSSYVYYWILFSICMARENVLYRSSLKMMDNILSYFKLSMEILL